MKKLTLITILILINGCISYRTLNKPDNISEIINTKLLKDEAYILSNEWMVETFNDSESVIEFTDKEVGIIKGKYLMAQGIDFDSSYYTSISPLFVIITIRVKDSLVRFEINHNNYPFTLAKAYGREYGITPQQFTAKGMSLIEDFEIFIETNSENQNW